VRFISLHNDGCFLFSAHPFMLTGFLKNRPLYINQSIERVDIIEFSFPSGHTFACTICWIFLCFMFSSLDEKNILSSGDTTETGTPIESHGNRNTYHDTFGPEPTHTNKHGLFASESDFVLRMRKRQYYALSMMKMVFSPIFGFPIILLTGFSRAYFGLHFPHEFIGYCRRNPIGHLVVSL